MKEDKISVYYAPKQFRNEYKDKNVSFIILE